MSTGDKFLKRDLLPFFVCRKIKVRFLFLFILHTPVLEPTMSVLEMGPSSQVEEPFPLWRIFTFQCDQYSY
ncbi:hypothetical protein EBB54_16940 [Schaedlerella arabinosiphila]|uniref:Uncharacterized protein n=1 Tax=Schaedlerella arabinosiphila TaxID=2044587 RepID=A0A3R8LZV4_9FIRM|nr:hypothetical protein EBB54_16940 [Schaedlerella arabinosiphila]